MPAEPALKKLAEENSIGGNGIEDLVHSKKMNSIVLKEMQTAGRSGGLTGCEIIDGVVMSDEEWNSANVSTLISRSNLRRPFTYKLVGFDYSCTEDQPEKSSIKISQGD